MKGRIWLLRAAAIVAALFGALTIRSGGAVLLGDPAAVRDAGDAVPFVLWFNFLAGFAYLAAAVGLWRARLWGAWTAIAIALLTALAFALFGLHIATGGAFEMRTVWAMTLRTVVWGMLAVFCCIATGCIARPQDHVSASASGDGGRP